MANVIRVRVENPDDLLNTGMYGAGALIRLQSSATETGAYTDVTTAAIVSATNIYAIYDSAGGSTTWYKTRYESASGALTSDYSAAFQAGQPSTLCDFEDIKQQLRVASTDTTQDEEIIQWCESVTDFIHGFTGRSFLPDSTTQYTYDGFDATENGRCILVPTGIQSVSLLEVAMYTGGPYNTIPSTDFFLRPQGADLMPGWPYTELWMTDIPSSGNPAPYFFRGFNTVRATGVFGWVSIPKDIEKIARTLVVAALRERGSGGGDAVTIGIDGERTFERALSYVDRETLKRYAVKPVYIV